SFYFNYFLGNDSSRWASFVPAYGEVLYENLYPNIDLRFYFTDNGLKYDFIVHPGGEVGRIGMRYEGCDVREEGGELTMRIGEVMIREGTLYVYQEMEGGEREEVGGRYDVDGGVVRYDVGRYDERRDLIIDPLVFSTYVGGTNAEVARDVYYGKDGGVYVIGITGSTDFPTTPGAYDRSQNGDSDVFIIKLNFNATTLIYGTYIGGSKKDLGMGISLDTTTNIYFSGFTNSLDFPVTSGAYDRSFNGTWDAFVGKLNSAGSSLLFSTFIGGSGDETVYKGMEVDENGFIYLGGWTDSTDFPVTNGSYDTNHSGTEGFILKLNVSGDKIISSTFLGGRLSERVYSIRLKNGNLYVAGSTTSTDFPTTSGAYHTTLYGSWDAFVSVLDVNLTTLKYSTYFGGSRGNDSDDYATGIDVDSEGNIYIAGLTDSTDLPTTPGAFDRSFNGGDNDAFVAKFNYNLGTLIYSTYIGGSSAEGSPDFNYRGVCLSIESAGHAIISGRTLSREFPVTADAFDNVANPLDGYMSIINHTGGLLYSTFIGGSSGDSIYGQYVAPGGFVYLVGYTGSTDFPVTNNSYQGYLYGGIIDAFVLKIYPFTPLPPKNLTAVPGNESVILRWEHNRRPWEIYPHGYRIYRAEMTEEGNTSFELLDVTGNVTQYVDRNLTNRTRYIYALRAFHWGGNSSLTR
ncbi:MAG: hypothetical protein DRG69_09960, partial [Deltaproteobacteria bacterium]